MLTFSMALRKCFGVGGGGGLPHNNNINIRYDYYECELYGKFVNTMIIIAPRL